MKNKKGFTLIELLAVIVILAIIALIAVPVILNMIKTAKKSAARTSSLGFIDAVEYYSRFSEIGNTSIAMTEYSEKLPKAKIVNGNTTTYVNVTCSFDGSSWQTLYESPATLDVSAETCGNFFGTENDNGVISKLKGKIPTEASIIIDSKGKVQSGTTLKYNGFTCTYDGSDITNCS